MARRKRGNAKTCVLGLPYPFGEPTIYIPFCYKNELACQNCKIAIYCLQHNAKSAFYL